MEYDERTYFSEEAYEQVNGFVLLQSNEESGRYQVAEKWLKEDGEDRWLSYWIPESDLKRRHEDGACTEKGQVTDEQFKAICQKEGVAAKSVVEA